MTFKHLLSHFLSNLVVRPQKSRISIFSRQIGEISDNANFGFPHKNEDHHFVKNYGHDKRAKQSFSKSS